MGDCPRSDFLYWIRIFFQAGRILNPVCMGWVDPHGVALGDRPRCF